MRALALVLLLAACDSTKGGAGDSGAVADGADGGDGGDGSDGGGSANFSVDPESLDFGALFVGQSAEQTITIQNTGDVALSLELALTSGQPSAWSFTLDEAAPGPGEAATLAVVLIPSTWGNHDATLSITDGSSGDLVTVPITAAVQTDADGDGVGSVESGGADCDDLDATVNPDATEVWYDGVDGNCDGADDFDQDGDGSTVDVDCDDTDATSYPGATEVWYDGVDEACDGGDDYDQDGDGVTVDADCHDNDNTVYPGAADTWYDGIDSDCAGNDDYDQDNDGSEVTVDCDDLDPTAYPGAAEVWYDGVDQACDGGNDYDQDGDGVNVGTDCLDTDATVYPGAPDTWYDGIDSDCAGNDDDDQDGDGYPLGADCNDTDATINPGVADTWYDGIDSNCDGADDFDQDGDTYNVSVDCDDTDASAYPGATEVWYDGVDQACDGGSDYDQDGDGVDYPVDCNDTDATVSGPVAETWDGKDNDCDGVVDDFSITDLYTAYVTGTTANQLVGDPNTLSMGGDSTGDGLPDLAVGSTKTSYGNVWVIAGDDMVSAAGLASAYDSANFTGYYSYYLVGGLQGPAGDTNNDGVDDVISTGPYGNYGVAWLFEGAVSSQSAYYAEATFAGDDTEDGLQISALGDIDADGYAEVLVGGYLDNYGDRDAGIVAIFSTSSGFGYDYDFGDVYAEINGDNAYDYLGYSLAVGDWDGDGYDDILTGAPGVDTGASGGGAVYLVSGNASLAWGSEVAEDIYTTRVLGTTASGALGRDQLAQPGDLDGSGASELVLSNEALGKVWMFLDSQTGNLNDTGATATFTGTAGDFGASVSYDTDFTGDGNIDLIIGDDGDDQAASNAGALWFFPEFSALTGSLTTANAKGVITGALSGDALGSGLASGYDLDNDGANDVLVGASGSDSAASNAGKVYLLLGL
jgi:hypothetical protein